MFYMSYIKHGQSQRLRYALAAVFDFFPTKKKACPPALALFSLSAFSAISKNRFAHCHISGNQAGYCLRGRLKAHSTTHNINGEFIL